MYWSLLIQIYTEIHFSRMVIYFIDDHHFWKMYCGIKVPWRWFDLFYWYHSTYPNPLFLSCCISFIMLVNHWKRSFNKPNRNRSIQANGLQNGEYKTYCFWELLVCQFFLLYFYDYPFSYCLVNHKVPESFSFYCLSSPPTPWRDWLWWWRQTMSYHCFHSD